MYNKLFTKILDSSIWLEPNPTRIVWLTFVAVMDETGFAQFASVANVARRAIVTLDEARAAIHTLESPDPDSSDPDNDGRRIERVPGGWIVINAGKYRALVTRAVIQEQTRQRVARHRAKARLPDATPVVTKTPAVTPVVTNPVTPNTDLALSVTPSDTDTQSTTEERRGLDRTKKEEGDGEKVEVIEGDDDDAEVLTADDIFKRRMR